MRLWDGRGIGVCWNVEDKERGSCFARGGIKALN
jgi:hypothetical protein